MSDKELLGRLWEAYGGESFLYHNLGEDLALGIMEDLRAFEILLRLAVNGEVVGGFGVTRKAGGVYQLRKAVSDEN